MSCSLLLGFIFCCLAHPGNSRILSVTRVCGVLASLSQMCQKYNLSLRSYYIEDMDPLQ